MDNIRGVLDFFSNPKENLIRVILETVINSSYWICLYVCAIGIILYVLGFKKAGKYSTASVAIYFLLQCLKLAL